MPRPSSFPSQRLAPAALLRGELEDGQEARLLVRRVSRHLEGVFFVRRAELVEEALHGERVDSVADGAPEPDRNTGVVHVVIDVEVGHAVGQVGRALERSGRSRS